MIEPAIIERYSVTTLVMIGRIEGIAVTNGKFLLAPILYQM
jgi:hypothetical protein